MWNYTYMDANPYELYHYGILGQKWGIRRYQNADGTLTDAGKKRYWGSGSDYTHVGRKRYIKDLVKDYNEINGTDIKVNKAIVRIDGKYFNGKGVELDPRNLEITRLTGKSRAKDEAERAAIKITNDSTKLDIDRKPKEKMTYTEMALAKQYYSNLNDLEKNGAAYVNNHLSSKERFKRKAGEIFSSAASEEGKKVASMVLSAIGGIAAAKIVGVINEKFKDGK